MDESEESNSSVLEFFILVGKLKHLKRTGWVKRDIQECESIAGHMYRMSIMAFLLDDSTSHPLHRDKCIKMALIHDIAECIVGDLTPYCGVSKDEKHRRELEAMKRLCCLVKEEVGKEFMDLFQEYEEQQTKEAKTVKDLDKFDMLLQAYEYEKKSDNSLNLQTFFDNTIGFQNSTVLKWVEELNVLRNGNPPQTFPVSEGPHSSIFNFFMLVGTLKHLKRTGWVMRKVPDCETVAGHMYQMSIMAFLLDDASTLHLNRDKCIKMSLIHDLAECTVGDFTPYCGISREEKERREMEAMKSLCSVVGKKVGMEFLDLYEEFDKQETTEAKAVRDLDKFDFLLQAYEYEKLAANSLNFQTCFDGTKGFENSVVLKWVQEIQRLRSKNPPQCPPWKPPCVPT